MIEIKVKKRKEKKTEEESVSRVAGISRRVPTLAVACSQIKTSYALKNAGTGRREIASIMARQAGDTGETFFYSPPFIVPPRLRPFCFVFRLRTTVDRRYEETGGPAADPAG